MSEPQNRPPPTPPSADWLAALEAAPGRQGLLVLLAPYRAAALPALALMGLVAAGTAGYATLAGPIVQLILNPGLAAPLPSLPHGPFLPFLPAWGPSLTSASHLLALALLAAAAVKGTAYWGQFRLVHGLAERVLFDLRRAAFTRLLRAPTAAHHSSEHGDTLDRLAAGAQPLEAFLVNAAAPLLGDAFQVVALIAVCVATDARLAFAAFVVLPLAGWPVARISRHVRRHTHDGSAAGGRAWGRAAAALAGILDVKIFAQEDREAAEFTHRMHAAIQARRRSIHLRGLASPLMEWLGAIGLALALETLAAAPSSPAGAHATFLAALFMLYRPLKGIARGPQYIEAAVAALERITAMTARFDVPIAPAATAPETWDPLVLEHITVAYGPVTALRDVNLSFEPGTITAVRGPSGAGKSTLLRVLAGLQAPTTGRALAGGVPIACVAPELRARHLALVHAEPFFFAGTLRDNLTYGAPLATEAQIRAALDLAACAWVHALPGGLDAPIAERGANLSSGQKQRLALARALLADPRVLLLDEFTSHLDAGTEAAIMSGLARWGEGRVIVVAGHRDRPVRWAARVAVLENGALVRLLAATPTAWPAVLP